MRPSKVWPLALRRRTSSLHSPAQRPPHHGKDGEVRQNPLPVLSYLKDHELKDVDSSAAAASRQSANSGRGYDFGHALEEAKKAIARRERHRAAETGPEELNEEQIQKLTKTTAKNLLAQQAKYHMGSISNALGDMTPEGREMIADDVRRHVIVVYPLPKSRTSKAEVTLPNEHEDSSVPDLASVMRGEATLQEATYDPQSEVRTRQDNCEGPDSRKELDAPQRRNLLECNVSLTESSIILPPFQQACSTFNIELPEIPSVPDHAAEDDKFKVFQPYSEPALWDGNDYEAVMLPPQAPPTDHEI
ncbi:hypothetical protein BDZ85DRAFT_121228 [Elsinoe ampelina]|uniref:Uncharacterized protein n=1 Tax=Elsinoe ampelina TaxID=302913 RepID=A0A6A6GBX7_9PEZI|nr:hypothetical protein BDZ85DRAFT_121228 [Elsinoe ampelina]